MCKLQKQTIITSKAPWFAINEQGRGNYAYFWRDFGEKTSFQRQLHLFAFNLKTAQFQFEKKTEVQFENAEAQFEKKMKFNLKQLEFNLKKTKLNLKKRLDLNLLKFNLKKKMKLNLKRR